MSSHDYDEREKVSMRAPTFDGRKENWPIYKTKMESYFARLGMSDLLVKGRGDAIVEEGGTFSSDPDIKKQEEKMQRDRHRRSIFPKGVDRGANVTPDTLIGKLCRPATS